jgi:hypothetical protein
MAVLEDYNPDFFAMRYNIPEEHVTALNGGASEGKILWELDDGPESEYNEFIKMIRFICDNDMTVAKNYKKACEI